MKSKLPPPVRLPPISTSIIVPLPGIMSTNEQSSVLGILHHKTELHVMSINQNTGLMDIYVSCSGKWPEIRQRTYSLKYKAPQYNEYVSMLDDFDIKNMIQLCSAMKMTTIDIVTCCKDELSRRGGQSSNGVRTNMENEEDLGISGVCGNFIDAWTNFIREKSQTFNGPDDFRLNLKNYCVAIKSDFVFCEE